MEDVDETPVVSGPTTAEVAENGSRAVATFAATDPDNKGIDWVLTGTDSDDLTLIGSGLSGTLTLNAVPDYEEKNQYRVTIEVREQGDGTSVGRLNVTVQVTNVDEPGTVEVPVSEPRVGQTADGHGVRSRRWRRFHRMEMGASCLGRRMDSHSRGYIKFLHTDQGR